MLEKYIQYCRVWLPQATDAAARDVELKDRIPRRSARRMSQLGKVAYWLLDPFPPSEADALIYGSTYAENRALEKYIAGLPDAASPTLFQTSIHPSAVQQALIARSQPLRSLMPMPGAAEGLFEKLCYAALHRPEGRTYVLLAEEAGEGLVEYGLASDTTWGIVACLSRDPAEASLGSVRWSAENTDTVFADGLNWAEWLDDRKGSRCGTLPGGGQIQWRWRDEG
ncbi:MAG: hypothetical protein JJU20_11125 [Opitutales bacterium]|nr:hypothetical protein [Opitutales bacterium]